MKKTILKSGILTIGMLSVLSKDIKVYGSGYSNISTKTEEEKLIETYSKVFEVNEDVILDKITRLTGNFKYWRYSEVCVNEDRTDLEYKYIYKINNKEFDNMELAILDTVRDIASNPESYYLTYEDIITDYEYETDKCGEDILKYYSNLIGINEYAALPIMYEECCTDLSSSAYLYDNNPAGMGPGYSYKNIEVGIIEYIYLLKDYYGFTENTTDSAYGSIGSVYCTSGTEGWIANTDSFYYDIADNYYYYADMYEKKHTDSNKKIILH